jgi:CubicO group peptidase (beta-lactamase class C family)
MRIESGVALLVAALCAPSASAQKLDPRAQRVERALWPALVTERTQPMRLQDRLRHYRIPGVSVAVVDNGRLAWAAAWGLADAASATPLTPATLMQSGSIAKPVAALGALKLVDQGQLGLDEPVAARLRSWSLAPAPVAGAGAGAGPVTLRHLLSHDAGLTVHGFAGYTDAAALPTLPQILDSLPPANSSAVRADRAPGQGWRYSGGGYVVLQQLMDDVTAQPFADWMQQQVLRPAGMARSRFGAAPLAPPSEVAVGHQAMQPMAERRRIYPEQAAAGLLTTPGELAALTVVLQHTLAGGPAPLLSRDLLAQALRVQSRAPGVAMGLGFFLDGPDGEQGFGHRGSNQGFESSWRADGRRALIVMANANGADELIAEIGRAVAQVHGWRDLQVVRVPWREVAARYEAEPLYLRGTMNEWSVATPLRRLAPRRYAAEVALPAGVTEFKFASADWQRVNLGATGEEGDRQLRVAGRNLVLRVDRPGRYRFELDASDPERPFHRVRRL